MDCANCGTSNPAQARFCLSCGTALAGSPPSSSREERKVVSVVFADLVGFTARAEELDPEDVERILRPYHDRLRSDLERYGGTVEKFIGDAVMAVFGAPTAHEDDAERAVRAALANATGRASRKTWSCASRSTRARFWSTSMPAPSRPGDGQG